MDTPKKYILTNTDPESKQPPLEGNFTDNNTIFETTDENNEYKKIDGTYKPEAPAVLNERGEEVTPAVPATFTVTADNSVWTVSGPPTGGRKHRSSKKSKKGGNKYTMTMGGKKPRKSKKGGKKSKKNGKKTRRY
jgi:hypothetical protein